MEKKTTQRIIGIFVLIALGIIVLPLFLSKNNETTSELANSTSAQTKENHITTASSVDISQTDSQLLNKISPNPTAIQNGNDIKKEEPTTDTAKNEVSTSANSVDQNEPTKTESNLTHLSENKNTDTPNSLNLLSKEQPTPKQVANTDKINTPAKSTPKHTIKTNKLNAAKAKHTAWVVQMGNFKSKDNARRLTDRLHTAGFKAFTRTVKSGNKERVRVYVGPENKQASAAQLSNKINSKIKMRGVVVSYTNS